MLSSDCYVLDEATGLYTDLRDTDTGLRYLYDNGTVLKVSGIIRPKEDASTTMLTGSIGYNQPAHRVRDPAGEGFPGGPGPASRPRSGHLHRAALPGEHRGP